MSLKPIKPYAKQQRSAYAQGSMKPLAPPKPKAPTSQPMSNSPVLSNPMRAGKTK